ncbi:MAG: NAD(P)H-dependent oxidoreductase [Nocardioidaceae bacterium]|nr:NAD(P)H-dependent oxidoreductase [Nocardioidaceae bacterium]
MRIGIIVGSTRPGRRAWGVARWVERVAGSAQPDHCFEVVDINDFALPMLDEPVPAIFGRYEHEHTQTWSARIASYVGFVFVVPEYNHSIPAALKNAIDFLYAEWHDKAAGLVGYGLHGGVRATEHLRSILGELEVADVRSVVALSLQDDFDTFDAEHPELFVPAPTHKKVLGRLLEEVTSWSQALAPLRRN